MIEKVEFVSTCANLKDLIDDLLIYLMAHRVFPTDVMVRLASFDRAETLNKLTNFLHQTSASEDSSELGPWFIRLLKALRVSKKQWKDLTRLGRFPGEEIKSTYEPLWVHHESFLDLMVALRMMSDGTLAGKEGFVRQELLQFRNDSWQAAALELAACLRRLQKVCYKPLDLDNAKSEICHALKAVEDAQIRLQGIVATNNPIQTALGRIISLPGAIRAGRLNDRPEDHADHLEDIVRGTWPQERFDKRIAFPNASQPMSKKNAADRWGGDMTVTKLSGLMARGTVRYKQLNRETYIFCLDDMPGQGPR